MLRVVKMSRKSMHSHDAGKFFVECRFYTLWYLICAHSVSLLSERKKGWCVEGIKSQLLGVDL